ncbi:MAG: HAMP domain-containing protein, partial [Burkholderiales bacterium]
MELKIITRINGLVAFAVLTMLVGFGIAVYAVFAVEQTGKELAVADQLAVGATDLRQIAVETAMFDEHQARYRAQWRQRIVDIQNLAENYPADTPDKRLTVGLIGKNIELAASTYTRLTSANELSQLASTKLDLTRRARTATALFVNTQEMLDATLELKSLSQEKSGRALRTLQVSIILMILILAAMVAKLWHTVRSNVLRPLREVETGARRIGMGDYSFRLNLPQRDEIGDLAREFNAMTARMEQAEKHVAQRTAALHLSESRFRDMAMASGDWFWETDAEDRFVWLSDGIAKASGRLPDWYLGKIRWQILSTQQDLS